MTLEDIIKQRLAEATKEAQADLVTEAKVELKKAETVDADDKSAEVDTTPKLKKDDKKIVKESYTEEDFENMSQEEFDSINEDQLDEISKKTLSSYIKKANSSKGGLTTSMKQNDKKFNYFADKQRVNSDFPNSPEQRKTDAELIKKTNDYDEKADKADQKIIKRSKMIDAAKNKLTKESVSSQVSALLEAEGLSEDFKLQAVTIFEAAVTDRVLQIEEELKQEFETQIAEAKAELNKDIDGFLSEAILQWKQENEVAIKTNFNTQVAESFMDGMRALIAEHNIEVPEGKEDALEVALSEVEKLNEAATAKDAEFAALQEQVNTLKAAQILESFKAKMTQTEFDRFTQLTESVQFTDAEQYEKQLSIVLENFGAKKVVEAVKTVAQEVITEQVQSAVQVITESDSNVAKYATFIAKKRI